VLAQDVEDFTDWLRSFHQNFADCFSQFRHPGKTVAGIYKQRRQVELFFKWIKQHLRIKSFYGTSVNAVKSHI
jgi:IS4 transposase